MSYIIALIFLILFLLIVWLYAIAPQLTKRPDFTELEKYDYAHRGLFNNERGAPENSLKAFRLAAQSGFGIELDVQLSGDGQLVVHHDASLKRCCGADLKIIDLTLYELKGYTLFDSEERIPSLVEALCAIGRRVPVIIELKSYGYNIDEYCMLVWQVLKDYQGSFCVESFDPRIVRWFRVNLPEVIRGQLMSNFRKGDENLTAFQAFAARNLLTNFLTRPNFEAYDIKGRKNISLKLARNFFNMREVSWTVKNWKDYKKVKEDGCICIFEGFEPYARTVELKNEKTSTAGSAVAVPARTTVNKTK